MLRLETGPVTKHIHASHGGESYPMKNYSTNYQVDYCRRFSHAAPRIGLHSGAGGYIPNTRHVLQYRAGLVDPSNRRMAPILADNYFSVTNVSYRPYSIPKGNEALPSRTFQVPTGFIREAYTHKSPDDWSRRNTTTTADTYGPIPKEPIPVTKSLGPKRSTGFVTNMPNRDIVTFRRKSNYRNNKPGWATDRPTGGTFYSTNYRPHSYPSGTESLPHNIAKTSGFVKGNQAKPDYIPHDSEIRWDNARYMLPERVDYLRRSDPAEYANITHPGLKETMYTNDYQGKTCNPEADARINELDQPGFSGYTSNFFGHPQTRDNVARFVTHNDTAYHDPTPVGIDRQGHLNFQIDRLKDNAYSLSTKISQIEPQIEASKIVKQLDPYQARSVIERNILPTAPPHSVW